MIRVPPGLKSATTNREGAAGAAWVSALPSIINALLRDWDCEVDGMATHGEVALVLPVRRHGVAAALKVAFPGPGGHVEAQALRAFEGNGAVRLLDADDASFALLLERAGPETLETVESTEEAIEIAGALARRLAVPTSPTAHTLADTTKGWEEQLDRQAAQIGDGAPHAAVERARCAIRTLASDTTPTLLHGDLHFRNVLRAEREPWLAIDPTGWRGTAAYDAFTVAAGGRNAWRGVRDVESELRKRIRRFSAAAGVDNDVALACTQARATSSYLYQRSTAGTWFDLDMLEHAMNIRE